MQLGRALLRRRALRRGLVLCTRVDELLRRKARPAGSESDDGDGSEGGIGKGKGPNYGNSDRGIPGGVFRIGQGVSAPRLISQIEPEYSEEARKAKYQGAVMLEVVVDENGHPRDIRITHPLGLGLDEKAIEAVKKWRFLPGRKDGKAVSVLAVIEVNFRLL